MKRFITIASVAALILLLNQCSPKPKAAMTTTSTATVKKPTSRFDAAFSAEERDKGKIVYQDNCGRCHMLYTAESRTLKQWERILPEMYAKGKIAVEKAHLIDAYVAANARKF